MPDKPSRPSDIFPPEETFGVVTHHRAAVRKAYDDIANVFAKRDAVARQSAKVIELQRGVIARCDAIRDAA